MRAPVLCEPLVDFAPLQPPEAVQEVTLVELHVSVEAPPLATDAGLGTNVTAAGLTVTVAVAALLVPPGPVQVREYTVVAARAPVLWPWLLLAASDPVQPPDAVHEVAFVELHVNVDAPPTETDVGLAVSVAVTAGATVTVAVTTPLVPLAPLQVNEYEVVALRAPVLSLPLAALAPLQPPDAAQEVALVELHVSMVEAPLLSEVCAALRVAVGTAAV